jgi:hypothetical protein
MPFGFPFCSCIRHRHSWRSPLGSFLALFPSEGYFDEVGWTFLQNQWTLSLLASSQHLAFADGFQRLGLGFDFHARVP